VATQYIIGCYTKDRFLYSLPIRASNEWLRKTLRRKCVINAQPLTKSQFVALQKRLHWTIEIAWYADFEYFVEAVWRDEKDKPKAEY